MLYRLTAILLAASLALTPAASANDDLDVAAELENIEDLSLDDLLERDVVAASRYQQRSSDSPVLVSTITAAEIEALGHRTLADMLPALAGVYVSNDRAYSYFGVRGFSIPGDYNTRVHLSIAGHNYTDPVYGQAPLGRENGLPAAAIARVELVRGAAYSVYGTGAMLGVIHVVPHSGRSRPGLHLDVTTAVRAETFGDPSGRASVGHMGEEVSGTYGHAAGGLDVFVAAQATLRPGLDRIYFPELDGLPDGSCTDASLMPRPCDGVAKNADDEVAASTYGIVRRGGWTVQALGSTRTKRIPTASYGTIAGDPDQDTRDLRSFTDATYSRRRGALTFTGHVAADYYSYRGAYPMPVEDENGAPVRAVTDDRASAFWLTGEARVHWHADEMGAHLRDVELIGGADASVVPYGRQLTYDGVADGPVLDRNVQTQQAGVFGEGSARFAGRLVLTAGLRAAHLDGHGLTAHPRAAIMVDGGEHGRLRASFGTAFRAPNLYERYYWAKQGKLRPERSRSVEISGERYLSERVRLQITGFHQRFSDLIALEPDDDDAYWFANVASASGYGIEAEVEGKWDAVAARLTYAWQRSRDGSGAMLPNSPSSLFGASVRVPLAGGRAVLGAETRYVGRRRSQGTASVAPWFLTSATLTVPHLRGPVGVAVGVTNLFDEDIADPAGEDHRQSSLPSDPRTLWLRLGIEL